MNQAYIIDNIWKTGYNYFTAWNKRKLCKIMSKFPDSEAVIRMASKRNNIGTSVLVGVDLAGQLIVLARFLKCIEK